MEQVEPEIAVTRSAWEVCRRSRRLYRVDPGLLVLGLFHAVRGNFVPAGAAGAAETNEALTAARLFAALQVQIARREVGHAALARLDLLLPRLPDPWRRALVERLERPPGASDRPSWDPSRASIVRLQHPTTRHAARD